MRKLSVALIFAALVFAGVARADELTPAKRTDIRNLIQLTGSNTLPVQFADMTSVQIVQQIQNQRGDMNQQAAKGVQQELQSLFKENGSLIMEQVESIYASKFTDTEIKELITFFKTPVGQKFVSTMPVVNRETLQAGQAWAQSQKATIESRVKARLKKDGIDLDKPLAPKAASPASPPAPNGEKK